MRALAPPYFLALRLSTDRSVSTNPTSVSASTTKPQDRLLNTAYELFVRNGIGAVGVDRIVAEAGVAKMTLYRRFRSKDELVVAALELREQLWTKGWLAREVERRESSPEARLLAIFDLFDEWFRREDYEGCFFLNTFVESHGATSRTGAASVAKLENVRRFIAGLAAEAGIADAEGLSRKWRLLMIGAITAAREGDVDAALRAKEIAAPLLESHLRP
jgi:AcrR family transcriptional regulator